MAFMMTWLRAKFRWILGGGVLALLIFSGAQGAAAYGHTHDMRNAAVNTTLRAPGFRHTSRTYAGPDMLIPPGRDQDKARQGVDSGHYVPLSKILGSIRRKYPGKHLNTRTTGKPGSKGMRYEVMWLTPDGRRLDIIADAQTGRILSVRGQ